MTTTSVIHTGRSGEGAVLLQLYRLNKSQKGLESVGISVFHKDADGTVYHTYSCYSRGVDMLNGAYHYLDLVPKGRDEAGHSNPQFWVRRHDEYKD